MDSLTEIVDVNIRIGGLILVIVIYLMFRDWRRDYKQRKRHEHQCK